MTKSWIADQTQHKAKIICDQTLLNKIDEQQLVMTWWTSTTNLWVWQKNSSNSTENIYNECHFSRHPKAMRLWERHATQIPTQNKSWRANMWKSQWPCHCHTALGVLHDQIVLYHPLANSHRTVSKDNSIPICLALPAHDKSNGSHCCREQFHTSNLQIWATKLALKIRTSQHQKLLKSCFKYMCL